MTPTPEQRLEAVEEALAEARAMIGRAVDGPLAPHEEDAFRRWLDEHPFDPAAAMRLLRKQAVDA